jgi:hypothetical protein
MRLGLAAWHRYVLGNDAELLGELLADDAVFHSPVVHAPQFGRAKALMYLSAAAAVFGKGDFRYVRELVDGPEACLEFEAVIDGIEVNGVDLIRFDLEGRIADFKVMIRPQKALDVVWQHMAEQMENT